MLVNGDVTRIELDEGKSIKNVIAEVNLYLKSIGITDEFFGDVTPWENSFPNGLPERWSWIACYPVKGHSEGYWVHIDILQNVPENLSTWPRDIFTRIGLLKCWTWEDAVLRANAAAKILNDV